MKALVVPLIIPLGEIGIAFGTLLEVRCCGMDLYTTEQCGIYTGWPLRWFDEPEKNIIGPKGEPLVVCEMHAVEYGVMPSIYVHQAVKDILENYAGPESYF